MSASRARAPCRLASRRLVSRSSVQPARTARTRSLMGPRRVSHSAAVEAKKQPPGKRQASRRTGSPRREALGAPAPPEPSSWARGPRSRRSPPRRRQWRAAGLALSRSARRGRSCSSRPRRPSGRLRGRPALRAWPAGLRRRGSAVAALAVGTRAPLAQLGARDCRSERAPVVAMRTRTITPELGDKLGLKGGTTV